MNAAEEAVKRGKQEKRGQLEKGDLTAIIATSQAQTYHQMVTSACSCIQTFGSVYSHEVLCGEQLD